MLVARPVVLAAANIRTHYNFLVYDTCRLVRGYPPFQRYIMTPFHLKMRKVKVNFSLCLTKYITIKPLNAELNPICHLLALLGAHHIFHVSRVRVNAYEGVTVRVHVFLNPHTRWS
jgi:hypothetical protein